MHMKNWIPEDQISAVFRISMRVYMLAQNEDLGAIDELQSFGSDCTQRIAVDGSAMQEHGGSGRGGMAMPDLIEAFKQGSSHHPGCRLLAEIILLHPPRTVRFGEAYSVLVVVIPLGIVCSICEDKEHADWRS